MTATLLLLPFDDLAEHLRPQDAMGNLEPLGTDTGIAMPALAADGLVGPGRDFTPASTHALYAGDASDGDTLTVRDATVQVLASLRASSAASWPRAIYVRGEDDGTAAQYHSLGLELAKLALPVSPIHLELRLFWQDSSGVMQTQVGGTFVAPADDDFVLLTATRRRVSSTEVVCRYYVNDERIAEVTSVDGDIAGATTGTTCVGGRKAASSWGRFFDGVIDELKVTDYEMSAEEVQKTWQRLTVHQPAGLAMLAAGAPPGSRWGRDLGRNEGKLTKWMGGAIGYAAARVAELRRTWLPHHADADEIVRWETLNRITPGPRDSLDTRRSRVLAHERRDNGYAVGQIRDVLAEPLDLDAADIEILNFTNRITDQFDSLRDELWTYAGGTWSISTGRLRHQVADGSTLRWGDGNYEPHRCLLPLSSGAGRLVVHAKLAGITDLASNALVGVQLFNWANNDSLWWGVKNDGGTRKIGYVQVLDGVLSAFVSVLNPAPAAPIWLRIVRDPDLADGYVLGYSTTDELSGYTDTAVAGLIEAPEWAGVGAHAAAAIGPGATIDVLWDDFFVFTPEGTRPFCWYAYRDPLLAGAADMVGARAVVRRLRPADTHAAPITSLSVLCDDGDDGGCDLGPMGGI
jgi:hypothetical protein